MVGLNSLPRSAEHYKRCGHDLIDVSASRTGIGALLVAVVVDTADWLLVLVAGWLAGFTKWPPLQSSRRGRGVSKPSRVERPGSSQPKNAAI